MHLIPEKYSAKHQPSRPIALLDLMLLLHTCAQILVCPLSFINVVNKVSLPPSL